MIYVGYLVNVGKYYFMSRSVLSRNLCYLVYDVIVIEQYGNIVSRFLYVDDHVTTVTLCIVIYLYIRSTTIIKYMVRNAVMLWMNININQI